MPAIAETPLPLPKTSCIVSSEFQTPTSNRFVRDNDATFGKKIFHVSKTHAKAMVDPHGVADDFWWEPMAVVAGSGALHGRSLSVSNWQYRHERVHVSHNAVYGRLNFIAWLIVDWDLDREGTGLGAAVRLANT